MNAAIFWGIFFVVYGGLYILFAFVAKENALIANLFRVPAIYIFLPENSRLVAGRVITGLLMIGAGAYYIYYMLQFV